MLRAMGSLAVSLLVGAVGCGSDGDAPSGSGSGGAGAGAGQPSGAGASSSGANGSGAGASGGAGATGSGASGSGGLGPHPADGGPSSLGGTMTFGNVGAPGWWPRRIDREPGDAACNYKDGTDTWGGHCCMKEQHTESTTLAPFDAEMTLIMKAIRLKQLAVYQPASDPATWQMVSGWDDQVGTGTNMVVTEGDDTSSAFDGDLTQDDCVRYFMQEPAFECGDGSDYYCPDDPGINHLGWTGSKLVVFLASMTFDDAGVQKCDGGGAGHPGPWVAFVASELVRDGGRKWNGACNCYSKTGSVGDGCGEINVFEVVMDGNDFSNREFMSTGVRSYQAGHVGGSVCGAGCDREAFPAESEVVDACAQQAYSAGPEVEVGGESDGCPVWKRPEGDRYFMILLDEQARAIQVAVIHPDAVPPAAAPLLPGMPGALGRGTIDELLGMRLPQ